MTDVRWQDAVRRLYDWYRNASDDAVYTGWNKPGWIDAAEGTDARRRLAEVVDLDDRENLDALLEALAARNLGSALGFTRPEIRLTVARRRARSRQLLFKFVSDPPLKKGAGRDRMPPSVVQTSLFGTDTRASTEHAAVGPSLDDTTDGVGPSTAPSDPYSVTVDGPTQPFRHDENASAVVETSPTPSSDGPTHTRSVDDGPWHSDPASEWHNSPPSEWHNNESVPLPESDVSGVVPNDRIVYSDAAIDDDAIDLENLPDGWNDDEKDWAADDEPAPVSADADADDLAENELAVDEILRRFAESQNAKTGPVEVVTAPWGEASQTVSFVMRDRGLQMMNEKGRLVVCKPSPGVGKCLGRGTPVLLYDGTVRRVEDVGPGDLLMGPDSMPRRVLCTNRGTGHLFRIEPTKGDPWVCNDVHVMTVVHSGTGEVFDIPLNELLQLPPSRRERLKLFQPETVDFPQKSRLQVSAYFVGLWLGDGAKHRRPLTSKPDALATVCVTTIDTEVLDACMQEAARFGLRAEISVQPYGDRCPNIFIRCNEWRKNPLLYALRSLFPNETLRIPRRYLTASRADRLALLAGLIDSDGHLQNGGFEIAQKRRHLANDIAFLARSLGFRVTVREKIVNGTAYVRLFIIGDGSEIPTRLPRKQAPKRKQIKNPLRTGFHATSVGVGDYYGFTLDGDGRFLLGDFTVTHNTHAMIELATTYHRARKRVIFGVFAKEQTEEVRERFKRADGTVMLRVITGRDETNCNSFDQVEAASQQGYAPGGTVCLGCAFYPENARRLGSNSVCLYYQERIRACQDFNMARRGVRRYPIILTTHTSAVLGQRVARSKHGTFWHTDFVFFDEDCSSAFASDHILRQDNLGFQKPGHPYAGFNAAIREAMRIAGHERTAAMRRNWKSPDDPSEPDPIHSRHGSAYVGEALWELLERVIQLPAVQRFYRDPLTKAHGLATRILSHDDSDQPDVGEFATLPPNRIASDYPHRDLNVFADLLDKEHWALEAERQSGSNHALSYQVRLEFTTIPDEEGNKHWLWQLAALTTRSYAVQDHNIVVGDAYADPEMYRRLFPLQRLETIDVRAHWPENTFCFTILAHASIGDVGNSRDQFRYYLNGHIAPIMEGQRGRRVLFYTHKSLAEWLNEWLHETRERWGVREWAVEHYGGGRGKDQYRDWDTVITATEYIPNMGGLVHIANAMNPGQLRVEHWSGDRPRKGRQTFGQSIDDMDPRLRGLFWRKCVDELAQAIHRIRPAIPRGAEAPPKQIYIFRKHIPLADDLLSATSFFVASGDTDEGVQVDHAKGKRATARSLVAFVSPEEMARAIRGTRARVGFWGHFAAHSLTALVWDHSSLSQTLTLGPPSVVAQDDTGEETNVPLSPKPSAGDSLRISPRELSPAESDSLVSALCDRVLFPTKDWEERAEIVRDSYAYRAAMRLLVDGDALGRRAEIRASWSSGPGSRFVCWGDGEAARNVLDGYDPKLLAALEAPF